MDAFSAIVVAAIAGLSGLISGLVVAYFKPFAEDRALQARERREIRRKNLDLMSDMLMSLNWPARRALRSQAAAIGDPKLSEHVETYLRADPEGEESRTAVEAARERVGELIRES